MRYQAPADCSAAPTHAVPGTGCDRADKRLAPSVAWDHCPERMDFPWIYCRPELRPQPSCTTHRLREAERFLPAGRYQAPTLEVPYGLSMELLQAGTTVPAYGPSRAVPGTDYPEVPGTGYEKLKNFRAGAQQQILCSGAGLVRCDRVDPRIVVAEPVIADPTHWSKTELSLCTPAIIS